MSSRHELSAGTEGDAERASWRAEHRRVAAATARRQREAKHRSLAAGAAAQLTGRHLAVPPGRPPRPVLVHRGPGAAATSNTGVQFSPVHVVPNARPRRAHASPPGVLNRTYPGPRGPPVPGLPPRGLLPRSGRPPPRGRPPAPHEGLVAREHRRQNPQPSPRGAPMRRRSSLSIGGDGRPGPPPPHHTPGRSALIGHKAAVASPKGSRDDAFASSVTERDLDRLIAAVQSPSHRSTTLARESAGASLSNAKISRPVPSPKGSRDDSFLGSNVTLDALLQITQSPSHAAVQRLSAANKPANEGDLALRPVSPPRSLSPVSPAIRVVSGGAVPSPLGSRGSGLGFFDMSDQALDRLISERSLVSTSATAQEPSAMEEATDFLAAASAAVHGHETVPTGPPPSSETSPSAEESTFPRPFGASNTAEQSSRVRRSRSEAGVYAPDTRHNSFMEKPPSSAGSAHSAPGETIAKERSGAGFLKQGSLRGLQALAARGNRRRQSRVKGLVEASEERGVAESSAPTEVPSTSPIRQSKAKSDEESTSSSASAAAVEAAPVLGTGYGAYTMSWIRGGLLGRGQFGAVYAAVERDTGTRIAVKVMDVHQPDVLEEMVREANVVRCLGWSVEDPSVGTSKEPSTKTLALERLMAARSERRIAQLRDLRIDRFHIFMEYVEKGSIASVLKRHGPMNEIMVRNFTRQLLLGLRSLHAAGIAHRDIKCQNLLLTSDNTLKLADFGCAKRVAKGTQSSEALGGAPAGSVPWMSPEVIRGEVGSSVEESSVKGWKYADVWAIGCTVIEMATGKPPWKQFSNPAALMYAIATCSKPPPFPNTLHDDGHDFLRLCFSLKPEERPTVAKLIYHNYMHLDNVARTLTTGHLSWRVAPTLLTHGSIASQDMHGRYRNNKGKSTSFQFLEERWGLHVS